MSSIRLFAGAAWLSLASLVVATAFAGDVIVNDQGHKAQSPEIAVGPDGSVHMVWIDENTAAEAHDHSKYGHSHLAATNLLYARSDDGGASFGKPVQINGNPGEVWGFSVSKPRVAVGANGTIHVFYPANDTSPYNGKPVAVAHYTRSTDGGRTFEKPKRVNTMATTDASDFVHGGLTHAHVFGTLAVGNDGTVYTLWIDTRDMAKDGDAGKVFMAVSRNDGQSFETDREILPADVCPCCQLTAFVDAKGKLYVGSRQVEGKFRDSVVMSSSDGGRSFSPRTSIVGARWEIEGCPLKPTTVVAANDEVVATYFSGGETPQGAYLVRSNDGGSSWSKPMLLHPGAAISDAPVVALAGQTLHVFWHAKVGASPRRIFTRASQDMGRSFGPVTELPVQTGVAAQLPVIAPHRDGSVQLAWQQGTEVRAMRWEAAAPALAAR